MTFEVDHNADDLGHGWDKVYEWVDATSHTHGGTNPVEQRPGAADNESAAGGVPHTDANTVPFTESAVQEYLDHAIHEWRKVRDTVGAGGNTDLAAAYIDAFQSVRSSLFGSLCPLREDHSNAC